MRQITISIFKRVGMTLFVLFFILNTTASAGKIFNWKNDSGRTHFTDYRSNIPKNFRVQIKDKVKPPPKLIFPESTLTKSVLNPEPPLSEEGSQESEKGKEGTAGEKEKEASEPQEKKPEPTLKPEVIKMLVAALDFLERDNNISRKSIERYDFNKSQGRSIINKVTRRIPSKKVLIQKIEVANRNSLRKVYDFLTETLEMDKELMVGGEDYLERLKSLESRMENEIFLKEEMITTLKKDLEKGGVDEAMIPSYRTKK